MRLFVSLTSPYARACRAVVIEKELGETIREVVVNPFDDPAELLSVSPAGTVPALARDDGGPSIADSRLISAWLDHLPSSAPPLLPEGGPERLNARIGESLAQTLLDKSVAMVLEKRRPPERLHQPYLDRWRAQALRIVAALQNHMGDPQDPSKLSTITMACALGHLDFRHAELGWREQYPQLATWLDAFAQRPSLATTAPKD